MPSDRTMVTELGTALGMLGGATVDEALRVALGRDAQPLPRIVEPPAAPTRRRRVRRRVPRRLGERTGLPRRRRTACAGRLPRVVEWKGTGRAPGDEVAPIDLRVDHVYLISCKYLSNILFNVSPSHVFDDLLVGGGGRGGRGAAGDLGGTARLSEGTGRGGGDWYAEVAPVEYQALYDEVRAALDAAGGSGTPPVAVRARTGAGGRRERRGPRRRAGASRDWATPGRGVRRRSARAAGGSGGGPRPPWRPGGRGVASRAERAADTGGRPLGRAARGARDLAQRWVARRGQEGLPGRSRNGSR